MKFYIEAKVHVPIASNLKIKRLIIYIPDEQFKMIRYYGLYAKEYTDSSKLILYSLELSSAPELSSVSVLSSVSSCLDCKY